MVTLIGVDQSVISLVKFRSVKFLEAVGRLKEGCDWHLCLKMDKGTPFLQVVRGDTTPPSGSAEMFEIGDIREHLHEDSNRENLEVIGEGAPDGEANLVLDDDAIVPAGIQQQPDDDQENPNERAIDEGAGPPR
ncbi:unnamed protein product [Orchesella dallaii]|uniref:Uncharacterized protein n=1 Tax=Orchesella dallaii TaxID=48710 RepID=A0ABP1Q6I2_9HEXA